MNVLLVEDNEGDRRVMKEAFASTNENVTLYTVENGAQALQFVHRRDAYEKSPPAELILLDLPGMHGREVLKRLKSDPETRNIPVIVLSSSTSQADICECYNLHANSFITKPMRYSELLKLVKLLCDFWIKEAKYCHV